MAQPADIPRRRFGRHAEQVSILALGGYHLGGIGSEREAIRIFHEAIDQGLTFMDCAWDYHEGRSEKRLGKALKGRRDRVFLMTKVCTHGRDARTAMRQLDESLRRLDTDHLDLWQIHECVYPSDPERHFAKGRQRISNRIYERRRADDRASRGTRPRSLRGSRHGYIRCRARRRSQAADNPCR